MFKAFFSLLLAVFFALSATPVYQTDRPAFYTQVIENQTAYLLSLQQADGSLPMYTPAADDTPGDYSGWNSAKICPYFSCIALCGLLEAAPEAGRETVERYIAWHFAHLNTAQEDPNGLDGTIFDYRIFVNPDDETQTAAVPGFRLNADTPAYDSTDSYAALFLKLLCAYNTAFPDSTLLASRRTDIDRVVGAMTATWVPALRLTTARPDYAICYLMDNCEVYEGLVSAAALYNDVFADSPAAARMTSLAADLQNAVNTRMYATLAGGYFSSVAADGKPSSEVGLSALTVFYPAGTAQLFPILCGLLEPDSFRARFLWQRFNRTFDTGEAGSSWTTLDVGASFPWALLGRIAADMNDGERLETYFDSLQETFFTTGNRYPYYCAEAGYVLSAAVRSA